MKEKRERNYGIDLLRILSMIMVPTLHILVRGGILNAAAPLSIHYELGWLLATAMYCAVNCYALISGYVGYRSRYRYSNIVYLYLQVIFYTLLITVLADFMHTEPIGIKHYLSAIIPFAFGTYWYFTAYLCMFFLIPFLNLLVEHLDAGAAGKLFFTIFLMFSLVPTIFHYDMANLNGGFSVFWLSLMYLVGACIKKFHVEEKGNGFVKIMGYLFFWILTWLSKLVIEVSSKKILGYQKNGDYFISYASPFIFLCAVFLLLFFANLRVGTYWKKGISFFAPVSFGVYLIHEEPLFIHAFMNDKFVPYLNRKPLFLIPIVLGTAVGIWLAGSLVDRGRLWLFNRLKVRERLNALEDRIIK